MTDTQTHRDRTALILGATGGIGGAVARRLGDAGWTIRALNRKAADAGRRFSGIQWVQGDAMNADDVLTAAQGASLIVHAVNPPGYRDWETLVLPMLENTIAAADAVGARILLPGTVYNFGPDVFPKVTEDSPQHAVTRKGAIRVQMEKRLRAAAAHGTPVIIVRAGDFYGPGALNSWFSQGLVKPGKPISAITNPGTPGIGHQWAYLPDVAETMVQLVEKADGLPPFAVFHMQGFWDHDGMQMAQAIARACGGNPPITRFAWWVLPLAGLFVPVMRELREMRYLWEVPLRMGNERLLGVLGREPHTPVDLAVRETLVSLGCLDRGSPTADRALSPLRQS